MLSEGEVLARAGELPMREVAGAEFAPVVTSPLLIGRVRGPGGGGGRRVTAGLRREPAVFAVLIERADRSPSLISYGSASACAHAFNDALRDAARDGFGASPPPAALSSSALIDLAGALPA